MPHLHALVTQPPEEVGHNQAQVEDPQSIENPADIKEIRSHKGQDQEEGQAGDPADKVIPLDHPDLFHHPAPSKGGGEGFIFSGKKSYGHRQEEEGHQANPGTQNDEKNPQESGEAASEPESFSCPVQDTGNNPVRQGYEKNEQPMGEEITPPFPSREGSFQPPKGALKDFIGIPQWEKSDEKTENSAHPGNELEDRSQNAQNPTENKLGPPLLPGKRISESSFQIPHAFIPFQEDQEAFLCPTLLRICQVFNSSKALSKGGSSEDLGVIPASGFLEDSSGFSVGFSVAGFSFSP